MNTINISGPRPEDTTYKTVFEVAVGNIGIVYDGFDQGLAEATFSEYVGQSKLAWGRASGEMVTLLVDGDVSREYLPHDAQDELNMPQLPQPTPVNSVVLLFRFVMILVIIDIILTEASR